MLTVHRTLTVNFSVKAENGFGLHSLETFTFIYKMKRLRVKLPRLRKRGPFPLNAIISFSFFGIVELLSRILAQRYRIGNHKQSISHTQLRRP